MERSEGRQLDIRGVVRRFGPVVAVAGVDLSVARGELLTILGPSGSGKTTLLRMVAGFDYPDEGEVRLDGTDITDVAPARRDIGMVFQNYALFPHMTVAQNIAFPLEMRRQPRSVVQEKVEWALKLVELSGYEKRLPRELSGGQQQRVALARAAVFDPRLLLLDEPFGALDRKLREQMQLEVKHLQKRLGLTTLFVTHDQEEALVLSDRIVVMNQGAIEQIGTPREIYSEPSSRFVADFIGESNLIEARVVGNSGSERLIELPSLGLTVPVAAARLPDADETIGALLRPEQLQILAPDERAEVELEATVIEKVFLGQSQKLTLRTEAGTNLLLRCPGPAGGSALEEGRKLRLGWSGSDLHVIRWN